MNNYINYNEIHKVNGITKIQLREFGHFFFKRKRELCLIQ